MRSTVPRKNFKSISTFIGEPDSRAQCAALEDNVKEFGLTYFGMDDKRQGGYLFFELGWPNVYRYRPHHWPRTRVHSSWYNCRLWGLAHL